MRTKVMRRWSDIVDLYAEAMGGDASLDEPTRSLIHRASTIQLQLEVTESYLAKQQDARASPRQLDEYCRATGALRRLVETLTAMRPNRKPMMIDGTAAFIAAMERGPRP